MARRNIIKFGDEALRKKSKVVDSFDQRLATLLDDLKETMDYANGLGLAAPQVGILKRVAVVQEDEQLYELINPEIVSSSGESVDSEGCLSVIGYRGIVKRPNEIVVQYFDRHGQKQILKAEGYFARAVLHEIDHLDGKLFVDIMIKKVELKKE